MAGNGKYGKNAWKVGVMNIVLVLVVLVIIGGLAGGAFFIIKPRYEAYQETKALEEAEEKKRIAKEEAKAKEEAAQAEKKQQAEEEAQAKAEAEQAAEETTVQPTNTPAAEAASDYIIADSNSRYLSDADVQNLSIKEVNYAKNELYARKGRKFQSKELREYFESKSWYKGTIEPDAFNDSYFNQYEIVNAEFLAKVEFSMDPGGYQLDQ